MAQPSPAARPPSRSRAQAAQMARQRESEAQRRQQWEVTARYFKQQNVCGQLQDEWSSSRSYHKSMASYYKQRLKEEKEAELEQRRRQLRGMLQQEQEQLEAELREVVFDNRAVSRQMMQRTEELRTARKERGKKIAEELQREQWRKNCSELREVQSTLHKDHVVNQWKEQISAKRQQEEAEQEERRIYESENERARKEAMERIQQAEERRKAEERKRGEELCKQIEELKLREEEATCLKKEQEALLVQQWQLEKIEEERRKVEEKQKKSEMRKFLIRQYRTQLKRRAQQVQEELEEDRKILAGLMEGEDESKWLETTRRQKAITDIAWMKQAIDEQLQLEREREAEFDTLQRAEARDMWEKREAQWEKERVAREHLMHEVFATRQQQLEQKMQKNREAQEESLRIREMLIQEVEQEKETRRREREQEDERRTARKKELDAQVEQKRREQWDEISQKEREEEKEQEAAQIREEVLRLEMQRMAKKGYQERVSPQSLYLTDVANMALFPEASGVFSCLDLTPRVHYEVHGEDEVTTSAPNITGQRFSFMQSPATSTASSPAYQNSTPPHRATVSKTFQSRKDDDAAGIGGVTKKVEELILASQSLLDVTAAIRELTNVTATPRVTLTPSELQTIKQGFTCLICLKFIEEPVFMRCCKSIIGCKACVEQWQRTADYCAKCRGNSTRSNVFEVNGLAETFSVLKSLFGEE